MEYVVISGSPGVGKSKVLEALSQANPHLRVGISHTTRPARPEESPDVHYHFVNMEAFLQKIAQEEFLEYTLQGNTYYGTSWNEVTETPGEGISCVIFDVDVSGGLAIKRSLPNTTLIFLYAPEDEIERRLRQREKDRMTESEILFRLRKGQDELRIAQDSYDYIVRNENIARCVKDITQILNTSQNLGQA